MYYFIARVVSARTGVSPENGQVLIRAQNESGATQVLNELEALSQETVTPVPGNSPETQESLFEQPRLIPISKTTYLEMKRVLPAYSQPGLTPEIDDGRAARMRPLAQVVSEILKTEWSVPVDADLLVHALVEAQNRPQCSGIFVPESCANDGAYPYGPRILAKFQPQEWKDNKAIDIDGAFEQDVTSRILSLSLDEIQRLKDGRANVENLVTHHHTGPRFVEVVDAVLEYFEVRSQRKITQEMLDSARIRASVDLSQLREEVTAPERVTFQLWDGPYNAEELKATDWRVNCVIPVPACATYSDSALERAISEVVTGSELALTDIKYKASDDENYGPDHVALHVTGRVTNPDIYFETNASGETPRTRELRQFVNALVSSDIFEMATSRTNRRYRIVDRSEAPLKHLVKPDATKASLDELGLAGAFVIEFELAEDNADIPEDDSEGYFSLSDLFSATLCGDNTWDLQLPSEKVNICFFS